MRKEITAQVAAALRQPHKAIFRVEAWLGSTRVDTKLTDGIPLLEGSAVNLDSTAKIGRSCTVTVPSSDAIWEVISVPGTEFRPYRGIEFPNGAQVWVPLGRLEINQPRIGYSPDGNLQVTAGDYWGRIQSAEFLTPAITQFGTLISSQIVTFVEQALPSVPILNSVTAGWYIGSKVYDTDRSAAIDEMTTAIGAELIFDGDGNAVLRPVPTTGLPVWTVDADVEDGVMTSAARTGDVTGARNVVVVTSSTVDGNPLFAPVVVWDNVQSSDTYAGPDPVNNPAGAGPFGIRVERLSSTAITSAAQAQAAGAARLVEVSGGRSQLTLESVVNPGLEPGDTIAVQLPRDPFTGTRPVEAHLIESVTIPLSVGGTQQISTKNRGRQS